MKRHLRRLLLPLTSTLALAPLGCAPRAPQVVPKTAAPLAGAAEAKGAAVDPSQVVARVGERHITMGELDAKLEADLARARAQYETALFEARRAALDEEVARMVLEAEAAGRGLTAEALMAAEIDGKLTAATDDEVARFYQEYQHQMDGASLEEIGPRIREFLAQQRREELHRNLLAELKTRHQAKVLLEPPRTQVEAKGPAKGPEGAKIQLVIFSDFECPFCARAIPALDEIARTWPNDVRFYFRHSPLPFHQAAVPAHEAGACADEQGRFWELHDHIFATGELTTAQARTFLGGIAGFDVAAFDACVGSGRGKQVLEADLAAAQRYQVDGTPAFFVNGIRISGAQPFSTFKEVIEAELAR